LEITAAIFKQKDEKTGKFLLDVIADKAGAKGTGKWTSLEGLNLPMPIPTIDAAVMMRNLSSLVEERKEADELYRTSIETVEIAKEEFLPLLHDALYFATIISYAQGLAMISAASKELEMEIPLPKVIDVWRGGCIIRSALLGILKNSYKNKDLKNVMLDKTISELLQNKLPAIQKIVSLAGGNNYAMAGLMSSLNYFNAYRRKFLPTNLIQAQRDFFGAHTYQRIDEEGSFHTEWQS
jgi:6-phosphogluconate dehydrogenase